MVHLHPCRAAVKVLTRRSKTVKLGADNRNPATSCLRRESMHNPRSKMVCQPAITLLLLSLLGCGTGEGDHAKVPRYSDDSKNPASKVIERIPAASLDAIIARIDRLTDSVDALAGKIEALEEAVLESQRPLPNSVDQNDDLGPDALKEIEDKRNQIAEWIRGQEQTLASMRHNDPGYIGHKGLLLSLRRSLDTLKEVSRKQQYKEWKEESKWVLDQFE